VKKVENFISKNEKDIIISFVKTLRIDLNINNKHIKEVADGLMGDSFMFDITGTEISKKLSNFQSSDNLVNIDLPNIFYDILSRISTTLNISQDNVFLQILNQDSGGLIRPHYDSAIDGFITYKCNISVFSDDYDIYIGDRSVQISEGDLYCFEASLYKHWTKEFQSKRILLSFGFILPYKDLGRNEMDPRVRLSKRIVKYFQN
jgi:hypothetical protein